MEGGNQRGSEGGGEGEGYIRDDVGQGGVAESQPPTRSDAVCLVLELLGSHLIEILETERGNREVKVQERVNKQGAGKGTK